MDIGAYHDRFAELRAAMTRLNDSLTRLQDYIKADLLIPEDATQAVQAALEDCGRCRSELVAALGGCALLPEQTLEALEAAAARRAALAELREVLRDYYRLAASAEDATIAAALEASKRELQASPAEALCVEPYRLAVEQARDPEREQTDEEYDRIREGLGTTLVRALDRGRLHIDADADVTEWLEGTAALAELPVAERSGLPTQPEEAVQPEVPAQPVETVQPELPTQPEKAVQPEVTAQPEVLAQPEVPVQPEVSVVSVQSEEAETSEEAVQPLWDAFDGYVDDYEVDFTDEPSDRFNRNKFRTLERDYNGSFFMLYRMIGRRAIPKELTGEQMIAQRLNPAFITRLTKQGYLAEATRRGPDGEVCSFIMPTSKGYAILNGRHALAEVFIRNPKERQNARESLRKPSEMTKTFLLRAMALAIYDHEHYDGDAKISVAPLDPEHPYLCDEVEGFIVSGLFEPGREESSLGIMRHALEEGDNRLRLIAASRHDMPLLAAALCEAHPEFADRISFVMNGDPYVYDVHGEPIREGEEDTTGQSVTEAQVEEEAGAAEEARAAAAKAEEEVRVAAAAKAEEEARAAKVEEEARAAAAAKAEEEARAAAAAKAEEEARVAAAKVEEEARAAAAAKAEEEAKAAAAAKAEEEARAVVAAKAEEEARTAAAAKAEEEAGAVVAAKAEEEARAAAAATAEEEARAAAARVERARAERSREKAELPLRFAEARVDTSVYLNEVTEAICRGRLDVASVLLKALKAHEQSGEELTPIALRERCLAYASGDPALEADYRASNLQAVFPHSGETTLAESILEVSAILRMYFSADAGIEPYNHVQPESEVVRLLPAVNELCYRLQAYLGKYFSGIDAEVMALVLSGDDVDRSIERLSGRAQDWLVGERLLTSNRSAKHIVENRALIFGRNTPIRTALEAVAEQRPDSAEAVTGALALVGGRPTPRAVEKYMDEMWERSQPGNPDTGNLYGKERNQLKHQLDDVLEILTEWREATAITSRRGSTGTGTIRNELNALRTLLLDAWEQVSSACDETRDPETEAALRVLRDTLEELKERFYDPESRRRRRMGYYIELLREPYVSLDADFLPYIEQPEEETYPYEFCDRVAGYLRSESPDWPDVIERMFARDARRTGSDYGCARVLREYLARTEPELLWPYDDIDRLQEDACDPRNRGLDSVLLWQQDFLGRLDMADGDEWFADSKERRQLQQILERQYESYFYRGDFGFYGRAMLRVLKDITAIADGMREGYRTQLEETRRSGVIPEDSPIFEVASRMIERRRFGAFLSYLQMAQNGQTEVNESLLADENSYLRSFVRKCDTYCGYARLGSGNTTLKSAYQLHGFVRNNAMGRSAKQMIDSWIERPSHFTELSLRNIIEALGPETEKISDIENELRVVTLKDRGRVLDYPHPMASFGSRMFAGGLKVKPLFGNLTADMLYTRIVDTLQHAKNDSFLFLVNCALTMSDRRKLARKASTAMAHGSFVILDRALALYLTLIPKEERWRALLQCSLPMQLQNPYSFDSVSEIPPDMFIGRVRELDSIRRPDGANLVFGGRQLGKTALLKRARVLEHRPEDDCWAVFEDIKSMTVERASQRIALTLDELGFFDPPCEAETWVGLITRIERNLMVNKERHLLLLLDEADAFLVDAGRDGYSVIDDLKRLQDHTGGRFKCVMAGLHNLLRLNNRSSLENNSTLAHLQGLTIMPLDILDARALLERPLSYLGFTITEAEEDIISQILYSTNYYPGLVHFYAGKLVEYMKKNAKEMREPPYELKTETLLSLLADQDFRDLRNDRIRMTLYLDSKGDNYYDILATMLCYGYSISDDYRTHGMSAYDIRSECAALSGSSSVVTLTDEALNVLLDELVTLNILVREGDRYLFRRASFTEIFDSQDALELHLLEILERKAQA